jgi:sulfate transport system ATP-binding protein
VVLMNQGRVEQVGSPSEVYEHPATPFVYGFLGHVNAFQGQWRQGALHFAGGHLLASDTTGITEGSSVTGFARPHEWELLRPDARADGVLAKVERLQSFGLYARLELSVLPPSASNTGLIAAVDAAPPYIEVDIPRAQLADLGLMLGTTLRAVPQQLRVFARPASVAEALPARIGA